MIELLKNKELQLWFHFKLSDPFVYHQKVR